MEGRGGGENGHIHTSRFPAILLPASSSGPVRSSPEEQLCEPKSSWRGTPLIRGPEEEPGPALSCHPCPCSRMGAQQLLPCHMGSGVALPRCGSSCLTKDNSLWSGHRAHLSQQLQTRPRLRGVDMRASAEEPDTAVKEHSPGPQTARLPE